MLKKESGELFEPKHFSSQRSFQNTLKILRDKPQRLKMQKKKSRVIGILFCFLLNFFEETWNFFEIFFECFSQSPVIECRRRMIEAEKIPRAKIWKRDAKSFPMHF